MVYSFFGVEVICNKFVIVKIFFGGDEKCYVFYWEFMVNFEVMKKLVFILVN